MDIAEAMERDRVERILAGLRENHSDPDYRRACLVELFERGEFQPPNDLIN